MKNTVKDFGKWVMFPFFTAVCVITWPSRTLYLVSLVVTGGILWRISNIGTKKEVKQ